MGGLKTRSMTAGAAVAFAKARIDLMQLSAVPAPATGVVGSQLGRPGGASAARLASGRARIDLMQLSALPAPAMGVVGSRRGRPGGASAARLASGRACIDLMQLSAAAAADCLEARWDPRVSAGGQAGTRGPWQRRWPGRLRARCQGARPAGDDVQGDRRHRRHATVCRECGLVVSAGGRGEGAAARVWRNCEASPCNCLRRVRSACLRCCGGWGVP